ncbi:type II toxin-antitoxin system PemI/MazE family antitoxin [Convivina praedatoris]|uniref:AbrB family transcriptional regulator n=1 Tax=Convivina praedatoris TaxID=2880963 RepID=A0ABN8H8U4_9LACO|nr:hypothetical protein [Convivina sp. LMG 32447]CAH1851754.1 hypothetical protein R077815_00393 [Convivina sp. LMG 32447]CAH1853832.1 hypothetical protein LMG032447_00725 [Convivina sp. LMG 32447]CAH1854247.1 hypothetical protein R078138_00837 [Convivina sp. LMG 32447]
MTITTIRKSGNSYAIHLPKVLEPEAGKEYIAVKKQNGTLIFVPKLADKFQNVADKSQYEAETNITYTAEESAGIE